jgi:hypothetical protein
MHRRHPRAKHATEGRSAGVGCTSCQALAFTGTKSAFWSIKHYNQNLTKFIFETVSAKRDAERWVVVCLIQDLFEEEGKKFRLIVTNEGEILEVEMLDKSPI